MEGINAILEHKIKTLIADDPAVFLVEIRIKPTNNVKIFLDADNGISIERLISYNRRLYKDLEESTLFPGGDFSLEVSSPGLDEPLKIQRQFLKNIGRPVEVLLIDGSKKEGRLISATETEIAIEEEKGKGKKKEVVQQVLPLSGVKSTWVQVRF